MDARSVLGSALEVDHCAIRTFFCHLGYHLPAFLDRFSEKHWEKSFTFSVGLGIPHRYRRIDPRQRWLRALFSPVRLSISGPCFILGKSVSCQGIFCHQPYPHGRAFVDLDRIEIEGDLQKEASVPECGKEIKYATIRIYQRTESFL